MSTSPEQAYDLGEVPNARAVGMGGALNALGVSTASLFLNPANMALAKRLPPRGARGVFARGADGRPTARRSSTPSSTGATSPAARRDLERVRPERHPPDLDRRARRRSPSPRGLPLAGRDGPLAPRRPGPSRVGPSGPSYASDGGVQRAPQHHHVRRRRDREPARRPPARRRRSQPDQSRDRARAHRREPRAWATSRPTFAIEVDGSLDFTTWGKRAGRVMAGAELFARGPLRDPRGLALRRRDARSTRLPSGFGYIDPRWSIELGLRRDLISGARRDVRRPVAALLLRRDGHDAAGAERDRSSSDGDAAEASGRPGRCHSERRAIERRQVFPRDGPGLLRWQASSMALSASLGMSASVTPSARRPSGRPTRLRSARTASPQSSRRRIEDGADPVEPLVRRGLVELDDRREAERVGEPVVHALLARERMRERVARAEALLERDRAHHRGLHHAAARREIVAVLDRAREAASRRARARRARWRRPSGDRRASSTPRGSG